MNLIFKTILCSVLCSAIFGVFSESVFAQDKSNHVFFITGNGPDIQDPEIYLDMNTLKGQVNHLAPTAHFYVIHNSKWKQVCQTILDLNSKQALNRLVLVGHSFGGQAIVDISRCIEPEGIKVHQLVTIDPVQRKNHEPCDVIPENVIYNHNYYQVQSPHRSCRDNHRENGNKNGITNEVVKTPGLNARAHIAIVTKLIYGKVVLDWIANGLGGVTFQWQPIPTAN